MNIRKALLIVVLCLLGSATSIFAKPGFITRAAHPVAGEYIVLFDRGVQPEAAREAILAHAGQVITDYPDINGYYVRLTDPQALLLTQLSGVRSVEENAIVTLASTSVSGMDEPLVNNGVNATRWGLDRIDQISPTAPRLDDTYTYCATGAGIRIYVVDTGVLLQHLEFGSRGDVTASNALANYMTSVGMGLGAQCWTSDGGNHFDPNAAHGTAVASVAAGSTLGVARGATIVDARALGCGGGAPFGFSTSASVTKVVDWICRLDTARQAGKSVINMSFSFLYNARSSDDVALNQQIQTATNTYNIPVIVAAGNFSGNTFWYSPANATGVIAAGGLNKDSDTIWNTGMQETDSTNGTYTVGSNYGPNVVVYAPAQRVESASTKVRAVIPLLDHDYLRSELDNCVSVFDPATGQQVPVPDTCTSGTSFSAPHVAGVVARYLERHPNTTPSGIISMLQSMNATYSGARVTEPGGNTEAVLVFNECP